MKSDRHALNAPVGRGPISAVVMDLHLPVVDGVECIARWRAAEVAGRRNRVPILVLSADVLSTARADALAAGADDVLTKPATAQSLAHALARHLT